MSNIAVSNVDLGSVVIEAKTWIDEILAFPGTDDYVEGTILARQADVLAVTASAVTGTGTGAISLASVVEGPIVPLVGAYVVTCVLAVTNGGKFKLVDPNGALVADDLEMTVGAGGTTRFEVAGLTWTIVDATDFVAGDTFTLTVAASGKLVVYAPGGAGGVQRPIAVLTYPVSKTGSGDVAVRVLVEGLVDFNRLVIDADGTNANITSAIRDELRKAGLQTDKVKQLSTLDNQ